MIQSSTLDLLAKAILRGEPKGSSDVLSLEDFKRLYRFLDKAARDNGQHIGPVEVIFLTERALIRFASAPKFIVFVGGQKKAFTPKDFEIVMDARFKGNLRPVTASAFVWTELRQNGLILLLIGLAFFFLISFDEDLSSVLLLNQMLVEANALFIGIFVLFTVSQNRDYLALRELTRRGLTHRLMQNDKYVIWMAILSLLLAFLSTAASGVSNTNVLPWISNNTLLVASRAFTAVSIMLLVGCFMSVTRYYLRVMTTAVEGKIIKDLLLDVESPEDIKEQEEAPIDTNNNLL